MKIWTVDAFTKERFKGNPAAVTIIDEFPDDDFCLKLAAEMNLSETCFVKKLEDNHYHIKWFTPETEIKLCGHGTLASAHILWQQNEATENRIVFESLSGPLIVTRNNDLYSLDFPLENSETIQDVLAQEIMGGNIINIAKAGDDLIVEYDDESFIKNYQPDFSKIKQIKYRGVAITAKSSGEYDFISRFFAPNVGVNEDPVCGSAHCKLADYWAKKLNKNKMLAFQASKRSGEIMIEVKGNRVLMSGYAVTILESYLL